MHAEHALARYGAAAPPVNANVRPEKGGKKMEKGHSEEYFKEDRDFWWNHDFLELMARRLRLDECISLLDVGCGQCHWSRLLVSFMAKRAKICALDNDPKWAAGSDYLRQFFQARGATVEFKQGDAHALPYAESRLGTGLPSALIFVDNDCDKDQDNDGAAGRPSRRSPQRV